MNIHFHLETNISGMVLQEKYVKIMSDNHNNHDPILTTGR
jgi:hypothetical protein